MKKLLQTLYRHSLAIAIGTFLVGMGLLILTWRDIYRAPLWGEVEVYTTETSFKGVDEIEVYVNLGRTKITYNKYDQATHKYVKHIVWIDTKDIESVALINAGSHSWSSWGRLHGGN